MQKHSIPVLFKYLAGTIGTQLLEDDIMYIQDVGNKITGRVYFDRGSNKLYLCTTDTTSTDNTPSNFILFTLSSMVESINIMKNEPTLLYEYTGNNDSVGKVITLSDDMTNYKYLLIINGDAYFKDAHNDDFDHKILYVPVLYTNTVITLESFDSLDSAGNILSGYTRAVSLYRITSPRTFLTLKLLENNRPTDINYNSIKRIYGIKY